MDGAGDLLLGLVEERQVQGPTARPVLGDDLLALDEAGQGLLGLVGGNGEIGDTPLADLGGGREDVPLLVVLLEYIEDVGLDPFERRRVHAELEGELVGRLESDAPDIQAELVGIRLEDREGPVAVLAVDLRGQARRDAVLLEEHDQVADVLVLGPGPADLLELDGADAFDLPKTLRLPAEDVDRPGAEGLDDAPGEHRADPLDQARSQELLDALGRSRQGHGEMIDLELPPEAVIELPAAADAQDLARGKRRERADDGQRFSAFRQEFRDRVAVVGIIKNDLVDGAVEVFLPRDERRLLHAVLILTPC